MGTTRNGIVPIHRQENAKKNQKRFHRVRLFCLTILKQLLFYKQNSGSECDAIALTLLCGLTMGCFAAETIYRGDSKQPKDVICYYQGGKFYSDAARKQILYSHPGNMVAKGTPTASPSNSIFRLMGNRIYKGFSIDRKDCFATLLETKRQRGNVLEAIIYDGFVTFKNTEEKHEAGGITILTQHTVLGLKDKEIPGKVLYTIKNNKIYRGASTNAKDCLLTYTGSFPSSRLLFMAIELAK